MCGRGGGGGLWREGGMGGPAGIPTCRAVPAAAAAADGARRRGGTRRRLRHRRHKQVTYPVAGHVPFCRSRTLLHVTYRVAGHVPCYTSRTVLQVTYRVAGHVPCCRSRIALRITCRPAGHVSRCSPPDALYVTLAGPFRHACAVQRGSADAPTLSTRPGGRRARRHVRCRVGPPGSERAPAGLTSSMPLCCGRAGWTGTSCATCRRRRSGGTCYGSWFRSCGWRGTWTWSGSPRAWRAAARQT